ncbi:class I adenylate-forming enzyme family protein [Enterovibrio paralichthyis]|uniref:class I adenylate-forming enzyme family protein n=1 Tax=Enterovibrio paralichthyis TaxID=2853805 RepID=UPI001C478975|nr:class I adenylate-forming enzyme family protein [Enterovibrio paralichthyis]MBV7298627.1 acyl--CoA ligase [Enterovibrio paralichthyis]
MINEIFKDRENIAIEYQGRAVSYPELSGLVFFYECELEKKGLVKGSRVCLNVADPLEYFVILLSCFSKGIVVCPLSDSYSEEYKSTILEIFKPSEIIEGGSAFPVPIPLPDEDWKSGSIDPDGLAMVTFTSGTTGVPKGVCHSLGNLLSCSKAFNAHNGLDSSTRMLHVMPKFYMAGILNTFLSPLVAGGSVVIADTFSAQNAHQLFKKFYETESNTVWLSPSMLMLSSKMTRDSKVIDWVGQIKAKLFIGTAPLPSGTKKFAEDKFSVELLESYGTSELLFISSAVSGEGHCDGVGRLLDGVELTVAEDGELIVHTPWAMMGYLNADGLGFNTGDTGFIEQQHLHISGRKKDIIIKGGQNISPRHVEEVALGFSGISEATVAAVPHSFWGEVPWLFVIPSPEFDIEKLKIWLNEKLSKDTQPEKIVVLDDFPRTVTGKVIKSELIEKYS